MTGDQLIRALLELPPDQRALPMYYMDEVRLREVRVVSRWRGNEYGVEGGSTKQDVPHLRLAGT